MTLNRTIKPITKKEQNTLELLKKNQYISIQELSDQLGIHPGSTYARLKKLEEKKYIVLTGKARGIRILR